MVKKWKSGSVGVNTYATHFTTCCCVTHFVWLFCLEADALPVFMCLLTETTSLNTRWEERRLCFRLEAATLTFPSRIAYMIHSCSRFGDCSVSVSLKKVLHAAGRLSLRATPGSSTLTYTHAAKGTGGKLDPASQEQRLCELNHLWACIIDFQSLSHRLLKWAVNILSGFSAKIIHTPAPCIKKTKKKQHQLYFDLCAKVGENRRQIYSSTVMSCSFSAFLLNYRPPLEFM